MRRWFASLLLLTAACGQGPDTLEVVFLDELVEAPARSARVAVVTEASCADLLEVPHDALEEIGRVLARQRVDYPVDPDLDVFRDAPRGRALAVDVSVADGEGLQISRACAESELPLDTSTTVRVEMHGLPDCVSPPTALDLAIVLDTSSGMRTANIGLENQLVDRLKEFATNFGVTGGVEISLFTHGHTDPEEYLPPTSDRVEVANALEGLRDAGSGAARHYEALALASAQLRARALCGRRPAVLWIGGGPDESATATFEEATVEVVGTRGELFDDLYVYGVGVSGDAVGALRLLTDAIETGEVEGALTQMRLAAALSNAHFRFQSLVEP